mmetsp:Transcript_22408/g.36725  ORF Transcript_22408/g.36725 Transcript_22408/m.36725 type:complete len:342 (-) Transcript_22408:187-1212(-)
MRPGEILMTNVRSPPTLPDDPSSVRHLYVFVHGFGSSGARHGFYVKQRIDAATLKKGGWTYICRANSSSWDVGTFWKTSDGIYEGGQRIAQEIVTIAAEFPKLEYLSFIGSSLGGLYSRVAAKLLFGKEAIDQETKGEKKIARLNSDILPGMLITLATPHLGVRCLYTQWNSWLMGWIRTGKELYLTDDDKAPLLLRLAEGAYIDVLKRFKARISYAPIWDDGIVAFASSGISVDNTVSLGSVDSDKGKKIGLKIGQNPVLITRLHEKKKDPSSDKILPYFNGDAKEKTLKVMVEGLRDVGWTIIHVNLDHKRLATLYPSTEKRPNVFSEAVLSDIISRLP